MALTNAEKQKRWRERRNELADALFQRTEDVVNTILQELGPTRARTINKALTTLLRNLKPDCPACKGTGFTTIRLATACGQPLFGGQSIMPCDCATMADAWIKQAEEWARATQEQHKWMTTTSLPHSRRWQDGWKAPTRQPATSSPPPHVH